MKRAVRLVAWTVLVGTAVVGTASVVRGWAAPNPACAEARERVRAYPSPSGAGPLDLVVGQADAALPQPFHGGGWLPAITAGDGQPCRVSYRAMVQDQPVLWQWSYDPASGRVEPLDGASRQAGGW